MISPITSMQNAFRLDGKNAVITGGNRGLGLGIALAMAEQGANVAILCRDKQKAAEALEQLKSFGGKYMAFDCDVTSLPSVRAAAEKVAADFGDTDILVNNAGVSCVSELLDMDENLTDWYSDFTKNKKDQTIKVNAEVIALLKELQIAQSEKCISKYVFTQDGSAGPIHPDSPTRYFRKFGERYGIDHFHPHKLRHSHASIAISSGADIASVSENLGHSDIAVTLRVYTHSNEEAKARAMDIFAAAVKDKPKTKEA